MVKEKTDVADKIIINSMKNINFKKERMMSILFKIEAPVQSWKK